jgi:hypothetical protein
MHEKEVRECLKRWSDNEKADERAKEQLNKNLHSR